MRPRLWRSIVAPSFGSILLSSSWRILLATRRMMVTQVRGIEMPTYSSSGYPAAVTMRSNRSLLVEGPNDKATVARLMVELRNKNRIRSDNLLIDTGADIPSASGGNRERVEAMHARVGGSSKFA